MPYLHQYDWIFAIGTIFAALDAYNIGANDVANSFATSVASRSLTLRQACIAAAICEFLGAVLVGAKVASTIKNGIISLTVFRGNAAVQMLGFTCALVSSASWLMFATYNSWTVSTTYSIVSALAGAGYALGGTGAVQWGWNNAKGLGAIYAGMIIAPSIAAGFAGTAYLISKYAVLERKNPVRNALWISPMYFFTVAAVLTMTIVYKGAPELKLASLPETTVALAIVLTGVVIAVLSALFWLPFVYAKVVKKDYTLKWWHFIYGPLLWKRPAPEVPLEAHLSSVPDYRTYGRAEGDDAAYGRRSAQTNAEEGSSTEQNTTAHNSDSELQSEKNVDGSIPTPNLKKVEEGSYEHGVHWVPKDQRAPLSEVEAESRAHPIEGPWILPKNLWIILRYRIPKALLHGSSVDIHKLQLGGAKDEQRIAEMHMHAKQYSNETEHLYSFLQVMTACTQSFAHGANDVSNAIGPFAAIYYCWSNGAVTPANTSTPTWMLAFGGAMIVVGLATYGYNIMAVLGNRLTMHSPSRGFSMEFGASLTVLLASFYAIPVSTTMCITGATLGVGLLSNGLKSFNWRGLGWILLGWIITVPIAGIGGGVLTGMFLNSPSF